MVVHHIYDETAGHPVFAAALGERRAFWYPALKGVYVDLVSIAGLRAVAASREDKPPLRHIDREVLAGDFVRIDPLAADCLVAGLIQLGAMRYLGGDRFQLVQHDKLTHSKTAMQLWWEAKKRKDTSDRATILEVRWRDGDQCRVCHGVMKHGKGNDTHPLGFTLDHRYPGKPAESIEDLAAVCRRCNGIRSDSLDADAIAPWQPVPARPYYTPETATFLKEKGRNIDPLGKPMRWTGQEHLLPEITILPRPASQADTANSDLEAIEITLPPQWAWTTHEGTKCHICGPRPTRPVDTASQALQEPSSALESPSSDLSRAETPLVQEPPQNLGKTSGFSEGFSVPDPSPPRSNPPVSTGGRRGGEGLGGVGSGLSGSGGRRARGRRGKGRGSHA